MKKIVFLPLLLILFAMKPAQKKRIIFFGDSITQMGINPGGYIDRIHAYLKEQNKIDQYDLIGAGIGGNKVYDLYLRLETDVLEKKPDIVVIYVGINDVWHKTSGIGTDIEKYEQFYVALIKKMQKQDIQVVVCTPTVIGEKKMQQNPQDADLQAYSAVIRRLAKNMNCRLVDLHDAFVSYIEVHNTDNAESGILTTDRVHLTPIGNQLVADQIIKTIQL
ncbi:MAG: hypothetical protein RLY16_2525 [Bacteroidota bacterium]